MIRFFRRLVATKDEVYFELIMNDDLFSPIIQVLKNNNGRYNLLDSAILDLFEFIQNEDLLSLMNHILTNFGPFLESIDYVNTFKVMRQKKESHYECSNSLHPEVFHTLMEHSGQMEEEEEEEESESKWDDLLVEHGDTDSRAPQSKKLKKDGYYGIVD